VLSEQRGGTANLLEVALENHWTKCVFSSTAAIYGNPVSERIAEDHPKNPINVYGQTKLVMEQLLESSCQAKDFGAVCLRYFNAAGAVSDASIGEAHDPETHLIPNALKAASGTEQPLTIFGDGYPTPDGTCIRDYIHVEDLADAHLKAMDHLQTHTGFAAFNLGNGQGFSVRKVFAACEGIVGREIPHTIGASREGDMVTLVADASRAKEQLGWVPSQVVIKDVVASARSWHELYKQE